MPLVRHVLRFCVLVVPLVHDFYLSKVHLRSDFFMYATQAFLLGFDGDIIVCHDAFVALDIFADAELDVAHLAATT